jgi:hypothetical protein
MHIDAMAREVAEQATNFIWRWGHTRALVHRWDVTPALTYKTNLAWLYRVTQYIDLDQGHRSGRSDDLGRGKAVERQHGRRRLAAGLGPG